MLVARSSPECHLYIALHPCACGEVRFPPEHRLEYQDDDLVAVYEADCPACGQRRSFAFVLHGELPPPPPAFGGRSPSTIICPGQFLAHADTRASVPAEPGAVAPEQRWRWAAALDEAIAAVEEVLKHVPPGEDAVPAPALFSAVGRRLHAAEPGRFRRTRLEAVRDAYRQLAARYRT